MIGEPVRLREHGWCTPLRAISVSIFLLAYLLATVGPTRGQEIAQPLPADDRAAGVEPAPAVVTESQVRGLLRQLEDRLLTSRDQAEAQLIELGAAVLEFLPPVTPQTSGELSLRLQRIRKTLENRRLEDYFRPSRLRLEGTFEMSEVLDQIARQTGNAIRIQDGQELVARTRVELQWHDRPFWEAVDDLMRQALLRPTAFRGEPEQLVLIPSYGDEAIAPFWQGAFRVDLVSIHSERFFDARITGQTRLTLLLSWEPRLSPLFMRVPMKQVKAVSDGVEMAAINPQDAPEIRLGAGGCSAQFELQIARPPRTATSLSTLSGQLVMAVPGKRQPFTFDRLDQVGRQTRQAGDLSVTLESARRNGPVFETRIYVEYGQPGEALESFRREWILGNQAYLINAEGQRLVNAGVQMYGNTPRGVGISYLFQITEEPAKYQLVYESPTSIGEHTVDFLLRDIPLP